MNRCAPVVLFAMLTLSLCATAGARTLYTTLGPNDQYITDDGWGVNGSNSYNQVMAMPFSPNATAPLAEAVLALGWYAGNNSPVSLYLESDNGGMPGNILATLTQHGVIKSEYDGGGHVQFTCDSCGVVNAGTQYWLVALEADPDSQQAWMWAYQDESGPFAYNELGSATGPWTSTTGILGGFRVDSTVPEPGSLILLATGILGGIGTLRSKLL